MASILQSLVSFLSPQEAEAKVNYYSPQLQSLSSDIKSGNIEGVDPAMLEIFKKVINTSEAIPETVDMHLEAPSPNPRVLGETLPGEKGVNQQVIKIRPYEDRVKAANTMSHELMHFLQNLKSSSYDDITALRQHMVMKALLSGEADKAKIITDDLKQYFPHEAETGRWFKNYRADTLKLLDTLKKSIGQQ